MLTLRPLSNADQAATYFERDDYYVAGAPAVPSSWWGKGAARLRLRGDLERDVFADLLHGRLPNGDVLDHGRGNKHQPGLDLTFSAPKSVSLVALVAGDERVLSAHERAVSVALEYLEQTAARTRRTKDASAVVERSDNLVVARFAHDSSRELDPQLHTHCVVLNVTQRDDGSWRAMLNRELFRAQKAAGAIYRAELARRLRQLGYQIDRHADGRFEIHGVPAETLDAFSQRRAQILEHLERLGLEGPKAADVAARATREAKRDVRQDILTAEWQNRARELGLEFAQLRSKMHRSSPGRDRIAADEALDHAISHITERRVIASERQLIQSALGFGVGTIRLEDLTGALDRKLAAGELLPAVSAKQKDRFARHFTTDRALATEQNLIHLLERGRNRVEPIVSREHVDRVLSEIQVQSAVELTKGQTDAIRLALSTTDSIVGIQGYAGTGKTTGALLHIRRVAESAGFEVRGFAPSAVAAELLAKEAGIESGTVAKLLHSRKRPTDRPQVWIVDESSMLGNEAARDLLLAARDSNARVVLVGDRDQLPSIEAGRAFAVLADHGLSMATIDTIVRQKDPDLRRAVVKTIARQHDVAIDLLRPRIVSIEDRQERLRAIANACLDVPDRKNALLITPSNEDRIALNQLIREGLQQRGLIGTKETKAPILVRRDLTKAEAKDAINYVPGDVVRFGRDYRRLEVTAKTYLTVKAVDSASGVITLQRPDGSTIDWKPHRMSKVEIYRLEHRDLASGDIVRWTRNDESNSRYNAGTAEVLSIDPANERARVLVDGVLQTLDLACDRHWEHAYASTIHAAQGITAERVFIHLDSARSHLIGHESWYVGISRARNDVRIYTDSAELLPASIRSSLQHESAIEVGRAPSRPPKGEKEIARDRMLYLGGFEIGG